MGWWRWVENRRAYDGWGGGSESGVKMNVQINEHGVLHRVTDQPSLQLGVRQSGNHKQSGMKLS